jgi:hypothetical protein
MPGDRQLGASMPFDRKTDLMPGFEAGSAAALATDPVGSRQDPPVHRCELLFGSRCVTAIPAKLFDQIGLSCNAFLALRNVALGLGEVADLFGAVHDGST